MIESGVVARFSRSRRACAEGYESPAHESKANDTNPIIQVGKARCGFG